MTKMFVIDTCIISLSGTDIKYDDNHYGGVCPRHYRVFKPVTLKSFLIYLGRGGAGVSDRQAPSSRQHPALACPCIPSPSIGEQYVILSKKAILQITSPEKYFLAVRLSIYNSNSDGDNYKEKTFPTTSFLSSSKLERLITP